ncbi:hypothetical protein [Luteimonas huabeiensis]|uniref:hypothetical protein n=1 Tax=Luteimonas huabeiensis TaxID=1244513 RepID=UPI0009DFDB50|nr:hypothetical protein [Luteimonas huabeiensis]
MPPSPPRIAPAWLLAIALATAGPVVAQAPPAQGAEATGDAEAVAAGPRTGDAWVDAQLADIDRYAARHRRALADELVRYRDTPRAFADELLGREDWSAGEAYFACALAQVVGRPCRAVVAARDRDRDRPWAELAEELGAAPGSAPYRRLKEGIAASYRRWARPLALDAELRRAIPEDARPPTP